MSIFKYTSPSLAINDIFMVISSDYPVYTPSESFGTVQLEVQARELRHAFLVWVSVKTKRVTKITSRGHIPLVEWCPSSFVESYSSRTLQQNQGGDWRPFLFSHISSWYDLWGASSHANLRVRTTGRERYKRKHQTKEEMLTLHRFSFSKRG